MKHDKKKQWLSIGLLTLGAAALAIFAAATLDAGDVRASLEALMPGWTAAIVGCMLLYYLCDALKYRLITRAFGCAQPLGDSIDVSMIGFFYSAVTPAAAGGQPFQVLHMHRRGIPTGTATSVICTVYSLWNIALVTLRIVRCRPPHLRCDPSASGSQLKRRSGEMNELRLFQKVGANDMLSARIALPRRFG